VDGTADPAANAAAVADLVRARGWREEPRP
jgi:hypothetical protein